ncbi:MAG: hypothetical protein B9S32_10925 [Verrucomicrobia bacterium Tous-C9LFEB]|nr:MAG: hypothetical protein B9S32_10925 [Verrucomicrobia bacterium Tous-C9LFEB]
MPRDKNEPSTSPAPPLNLRDIARQAGVSHSTVSRALRNHPALPRETCQKIQALAESLGYRTNPLIATLASQLRMSRTTPYQATLAFVTSYPTRNAWKEGRPAFLRFYKGAHERARLLGYELDEFWIKEPGFTMERIRKILQTRNIRGLLISPMPHPLGHLPLDWSQYASATIGYTMASPHLHSTRNHHYHAITLCLRRLKYHGHRRIGLALRPQSYKYADDLFTARYLYHQYATGQKPLPIFCLGAANGEFTEKNFIRWFQKNKPDALICMGEQVHDWCAKMGIDVPGELSIVDMDIHDFQKQWSGIDGCEEDVAAAAVDVIVQQLQQNDLGIPRSPKTILVEGRWLAGSTLAKSPAGS